MPTWSGPISLKGAKGDSVPQTLPNDLTANSVAIAPVSGDTNASGLTQRNASGATLFASDGAGNVSCAGTLAAAGALSAASAAIAGNETVGGNLTVVGTLTAGALTASGTNIAGNQTVQGNDTINGNLSVLGTSSLAKAVTCGSDLTATAGNTNVGPLACTTLAASGAATFGSTVGITGTVSPGAVNCQNNAIVGKNLTVSGTTQTIGLLTATGNISTPSLGIQSGGSSTLGTASADALTATGNISVGGTATLQTVNAAALTTSGNIRSNGNLSCTSGTTTLGGPVNISGATTMAALTASSSSIAGNESIGGTLGVTGSATLAGVTAGALTASSGSFAGNVTVTPSTGTLVAPNVTLTSGAGGKLTFADGTTQTTAASGSGSAIPSRSIVHMGQITNSAVNAGAYYGLFEPNVDAKTNPGSNATIYGWAFRPPFPCAITGWEIQQNINAGTTSLQYNKNGTSLGNFAAGSGTGNFQGTHANTAYRFAAGDKIECLTAISSGSSTAVHVLITLEWLA